MKKKAKPTPKKKPVKRVGANKTPPVRAPKVSTEVHAEPSLGKSLAVLSMINIDGVVTAETVEPHGWPNGQKVSFTGAHEPAFNLAGVSITVRSDRVFTVVAPNAPGGSVTGPVIVQAV